MVPIIVPKENVSDETYRLVDFLFEDGAAVGAGDVVAVLESSKSTIEVLSEMDGYIFSNAALNDDLPIGSVLAVVCSENIKPDLDQLGGGGRPPKSPTTFAGPSFSKKALELIENHGLDANEFSDLALVRGSDVEKYLANKQQAKPPDTFSPPRIIIYGGGGFGKMVIDIIRQVGGYEIAGVIDNQKPIGTDIMGVPIIGDDDKLDGLRNEGIQHAALAVGLINDNCRREELYRKLKDTGLYLPVLIHPKATVERTAVLGEGTFVFANAVVGSAARLDENCIVNSGAIVSHDCILGEGVHITPGAILAGEVTIGRYSLIGMGVTVFIGVSIGERAKIMNGCNVVGDVDDDEVVK